MDNTLLGNFRFRWTSIWNHEHQKKEVELMWQIWNKAVVVNMWYGRIAPNIDVSCIVCGFDNDDTILYRFWDYDSSQQVWHFVTRLLKHLATPNFIVA